VNEVQVLSANIWELHTPKQFYISTGGARTCLTPRVWFK